MSEFWIYPTKGKIATANDACDGFEANVYSRWAGEGLSMEVIEKSIYNSVKEENEIMNQKNWALKNACDSLQSRLDIAVECLKFYSEAFKKQPTSSMMGEYTPFLIDGGKRACEVLKQINPKGG